MTPGMKVAAAVVGGYVLGRRKKAKLAITMGAWLVGKKLNLDPKKFLSDVTRELASSPELAGVRDQVRDEVVGAGKTLAADILTHQAGRLAGSLQEHTESLRDKAAGLPVGGNSLGGNSRDEDAEDADDSDEESRPKASTRKRAAKPRSASQGDRKPARKTSSAATSTRKRAASSGQTRKRSSGSSSGSSSGKAGVNRG
ncbi:hypothetical protein [Amycolatopsis sp. NPDC054798]